MAFVFLIAASVRAQASESASFQTDSSRFTALSDAIRHPTEGCDGAVVLTPRPGTQFADPLASEPQSAASFFAKAAALHATWATTMHCTHTGVVHALEPALDDNGDDVQPNSFIATQNYSGYQISNTARYAQSGWTVPTVVNPPIGHRYSPTGVYDSSTWAGIGGSALPLIQAGSTQQIDAMHIAHYYFWYEIVGGAADTGNEVKINSLAAHPGDEVGSVVLWDEETMGTQLGVCNFSDPTPPDNCLTFTFECPSHCSTKPGPAVEWIVEAPTRTTGLQYLADFDHVNFYNGCWIQDEGSDTCHPISEAGISSPIAYHLVRKLWEESYYTLLAEPGGIAQGSSTFTDLFFLPGNP